MLFAYTKGKADGNWLTQVGIPRKTAVFLVVVVVFVT